MQPKKTGKYAQLFQEAGKEISQQTSEPASQLAGEPANQQTSEEREVTLSVKVPESLRRHWTAEAKRQGMTIKNAVIEALIERFGNP